MRIIPLLAIVISLPALAGGNSNHNVTSDGGTVSGHQEQDQTAVAYSDALSKSNSSSSSVSKGGSAKQAQQARASNAGNNTDITSDNHTKALGLELSSATAAPIDSTVCRTKQTAGWDVTIVKRSGRNVFDPACMNALLDEQVAQAFYARCMGIVDQYIKIGARETAIAQLERCGGMPAPAVVVTSDKERLERIFKATQTK